MQSILSAGASKAERDGRSVSKGAVPPDDAVKFGFSIKEAAGAAGISRSLVYIAIAEGKLRARKCRGRTIILREDLQEFLANLPPMKAAP
jgi:excisionase family DNA binding protein